MFTEGKNQILAKMGSLIIWLFLGILFFLSAPGAGFSEQYCVVKASGKTFLLESPFNSATVPRKGPYLDPHDRVLVLESNGGMLRVQWVNNPRVVGWVNPAQTLNCESSENMSWQFAVGQQCRIKGNSGLRVILDANANGAGFRDGKIRFLDAGDQITILQVGSASHILVQWLGNRDVSGWLDGLRWLECAGRVSTSLSPGSVCEVSSAFGQRRLFLGVGPDQLHIRTNPPAYLDLGDKVQVIQVRGSAVEVYWITKPQVRGWVPLSGALSSCSPPPNGSPVTPPVQPPVHPVDPYQPPIMDAAHIAGCEGNTSNPPPKTTQQLRNNPVQTLKILSLAYIPMSGSSLDSSQMPSLANIGGPDQVAARIRNMKDDLCRQREESTRSVRGANRKPYIDIHVIEHKEFRKTLPLGLPYGDRGRRRPDHNSMFNGDVQICDYVDRQQVTEVWVWMYHSNTTEPAESNMSMGYKSRSFFNLSSFGDISNSERTQDLPTCQRTYVVYEFNVERSVAEAMHDYGHQAEAVLRHMDPDLFWEKFVGKFGSQSEVNQCGWTHRTPCSMSDYGYSDGNTINSSCDNWNPDDINAGARQMSCREWNCDHLQFMVWWFKRHPGYRNGITRGGRPLRNWHEFFVDFDLAIQLSKTLFE